MSSSAPHSPVCPQQSDNETELFNIMRTPPSSRQQNLLNNNSQVSGSRPLLLDNPFSSDNITERSFAPSSPLQARANRNEVAIAERRARRLKLAPYQCQDVLDFVKDSIVGRQTRLLTQLYAIENQLNGIVAIIPPFQVSKALMENIKSFGLAVLLSPKLSAYKGAIPSTHVISIIRKNGLHLPANLSQDPNALSTLRSTVNDTSATLKLPFRS